MTVRLDMGIGGIVLLLVLFVKYPDADSKSGSKQAKIASFCVLKSYLFSLNMRKVIHNENKVYVETLWKLETD